jgi:hypothetical protein
VGDGLDEHGLLVAQLGRCIDARPVAAHEAF